MDSINNDIFDIRHYGCSYSKARSGFTTDKVKSVTTSQLDSNKYENDSNENFTSIKQLIVDIDTQDNSDWMEISKSNTPKSLDEFLQTANYLVLKIPLITSSKICHFQGLTTPLLMKKESYLKNMDTKYLSTH